MMTRRPNWLLRLLLVLSTGFMVGEGCLGPNDLRSQTVASFNRMVVRAMNLAFAELFGLPPEYAVDQES